MKIGVPAKINLSLRILGRREDGFHELETLMVPVPDLHDVLVVEEAEEFRFSCDQEGVPTDEGNLVVKAVRLYERATGEECRRTVRLEKHIPHGAGLGGGSSDAAGMLMILNALGGKKLSMEQLSGLAGELGSDVPFFLKGTACWCRGRGEKIEEAKVEEIDVILAKPGFGVSTPDAFGRWTGSKELPGVRYEEQDCEGVKLINDLERPVFEKFPYLAELKMWFLAQPEVAGALMSGSGATVFGVLRDGADATVVEERLRKEMGDGLWVWSGRVGG